MSLTLHASTVAIDGQGVLIEGPSGSGKSDLALRMIDRGAALVSDDYTLVEALDGCLSASAPATIAGKIEIRGFGIVSMPHVGPVPVALLVRFGQEVARFPEATTRMIEGIAIRELVVDPFEASAPIKVELALRHPPDGPRRADGAV